MRILKEGTEGFGLLVESDSGFISKDLTANNRTLFESIVLPRTESTFSFGRDGHFYVDCKLQEADVVNKNGRIYPRAILERELKNYQSLIADNAALSEIDHPDGQITISLSNVSHNIVKVWWEGNSLYGTLDILVSDSFLKDGMGWTPGDLLALFLKRGIKLGISSRAIGSVKTVQGKDIVQDDLSIICFDIVATPSTPNAYLFLDTKDKLDENLITVLDKNKNKDQFLKQILNF